VRFSSKSIEKISPVELGSELLLFKTKFCEPLKFHPFEYEREKISTLSDKFEFVALKILKADSLFELSLN